MSEPTNLKSLLDQWDQATEPFTEFDVGHALRMRCGNADRSELPLEWQAELLAFELDEVDVARDEDDVRFRPTIEIAGPDGTMPIAPDATPEVLAHWEGRAANVKHPVLAARYAGLVWDLTQPVTAHRPDIRFAHFRIDSILSMATSRAYSDDIGLMSKLQHALSISVSVNDCTRVEKVRDAIVEYDEQLDDKNAPGLWGFAFDSLWANKKVGLTGTQESELIGRLEARLASAASEEVEKSDPWAAEGVAVRLALCYRSEKRRDDVRRVLLLYGGSIQRRADSVAPIIGSAWLEQVSEIYRQFELHEDAANLIIKIRDIGPKANEQMVRTTSKMEFTQEEIDQYVEELVACDMQSAIDRIVFQFIPRRDETERRMHDIAAKAPMQFMITKKLQDHQGRPVATIGSIHDDLDGNVIHHVAQELQFEALLLRQALAGLVEHFELTADRLVDYLYLSPLFRADKMPLLARGLEAYLARDPAVAIHLLIPQLEDALRNLVQIRGGVVMRPSRSGGFHLRTLDELLRDESLRSVFGDDLVLYFRVLLTDQRGINLRNDVCHGISPATHFCQGFADRLLHCLLILARARAAQSGDSAEQDLGDSETAD
jgi:hypothetical protein